MLTEFVIAKGFDYYISKLEENGYQWFVSTTTKFNGILIALKSKTFNFDETFEMCIRDSGISMSKKFIMKLL